MIFPGLTLRLQQLEANISRVLQLLNEYEEELLYEDDPGRKSKYRRRIESLKQQKFGYEEEFSKLQSQLTSEYSLQTQSISNQLQEIDNKIEIILGNQASLGEALMFHFSSKEQELLLPFVQQLTDSELIDTQAFLEIIETDKVSKEEIQLILSETRTLLKLLKERDLSLPAGREPVYEIINSPSIDAKHALKVSLPILPFILTYEGELGLGTAINLKGMLQRWKTKFMGNR
ncbi:MAG TPA: hypothetical protein V6D29_07910 [Leptolyngbyaceae cyanobacterium]